MKAVQLGLATLALASVGAASVVKRNSNSWAGTSNYFLHGLSDADQTTYINKLASDGAKVIRLWVNGQPGGNACEKASVIANGASDLETTIGTFNNGTLDLLDKVLMKMQTAGLKALISPHDANMLCGANGKDAYCNKWGPGYFYELQEAFDAYDKRLSYILNYKGKYSGQVWKNWHQAIMGFDIQNEPMAPKLSECTGGDTHGWVCGRAQHMRSELGASNPIKIGSGGIGGDISHNCNLMSAALNCAQLDMISIHAYKGGEGSNPNQWANIAKSWVKQTSKLVYVEEWGVNVQSYNPVTEFPANTKDMNSVGLPWVYWQFLPHNTCGGSYSDGGETFGIFVDGSTDIATPMKQASSTTGLQDWTGIIY